MFFMRPAAARTLTVPGLLLSILAALALPAQTPPRPEPPVFRSSAVLVSVDVLVTQAGKPVTGLRPADFIVREEGIPRPVEAFAHDAAPLQVLLVLDVSGSMGRMLRAAAATARQALDQLAPQDEVAVFFFARRARLQQELTREKDLAAHALRDAAVESGLGAGTSLNDALLEAAAYLEKLPPFSGRRALIVLTDNGGVHYQLPDETVIRAMSRVNAVVNAIVPQSSQPPKPPQGPEVNPDFTPANIFHIASSTGGEIIRSGDAGRRLRELIERIRLRYNLMIRPTPAPPGAYRRLSVELTPDAAARVGRVQIYCRAGYYAPEDPSL
jgi:VWFA-related protein